MGRKHWLPLRFIFSFRKYHPHAFITGEGKNKIDASYIHHMRSFIKPAMIYHQSTNLVFIFLSIVCDHVSKVLVNVRKSFVCSVFFHLQWCNFLSGSCVLARYCRIDERYHHKHTLPSGYMSLIVGRTWRFQVPLWRDVTWFLNTHSVIWSKWNVL